MPQMNSAVYVAAALAVSLAAFGFWITRCHRALLDSIWFWLLLFSGAALAAVIGIGPKYDWRQSIIETKYVARERAAQGASQRRAADHVSNDAQPGEAEHGGPSASSDWYEPRQTRRMVPLWPVAVVLAMVTVVAAAMLAHRARRRPP
jgi:hypothetical protein